MNDFNIDLSNTADDDFFGSLKETKSSKLQQLFVDDALSEDEKGQSLKYKRPKEASTASSSASTTLVAKVVTAYRQGELQGKVGLALVQNIDAICNIIMYKAKDRILTTLKLTPGKILLYNQKNYWQFYDETSTYWSFSFDKTGDEKDFVEKLQMKDISFKVNHESEPVTESHLKISKSDHECEGNRNSTPTIETRNSLIKRMAKVGKSLPTLSSNHQTTTEFSDSSDTEVIQPHLTAIQKPSIAPRSNKLTAGKSNQQLVPSFVGLNAVASSVFPINPLESQYMQMLLTENRTQGSEIRRNINKLENKIEKVLDKLELYDRSDGQKKLAKDDEILELEEKLLLLKKENRKLKQSLEQNPLQRPKETQLQDILFEFKADLKKFNINYNQDFKSIMLELCDKLKQHNNIIEEMEKKMKDNESKLEKANWEIELNMKKILDLKNSISSLNQKENELKNQLNEKEAEALKQKQDFVELQNKVLSSNRATPENSNDAFIKTIMNRLYLDIADKLDNGGFTHSEQILSIVATSIKQQTLLHLQKNVQRGSLN